MRLTIILSLVSLVLTVWDIPFLGLPCPYDNCRLVLVIKGEAGSDGRQNSGGTRAAADCLIFQIESQRLNDAGAGSRFVCGRGPWLISSSSVRPNGIGWRSFGEVLVCLDTLT